MKPITQHTLLPLANLNLLMEIDYLIEQMANAHVPLDEGYEKLIELIQRKSEE